MRPSKSGPRAQLIARPCTSYWCELKFLMQNLQIDYSVVQHLADLSGSL